VRFATTGTIQFTLKGLTIGPSGKFDVASPGPFTQTASGNALVGGGEMPISWGIQTGPAPSLTSTHDTTYDGGNLGVVATVNGKDSLLAIVNADLTQIATFTAPPGLPLTLVAHTASSKWAFQGWGFSGLAGGISTKANPDSYAAAGGTEIVGEFEPAVPSGGGGGGGGGGGTGGGGHCGTKIIC
jgi:hypothetical protein